ncbi:hypothetical protein FH608_030070 [Nonomuraea phyllanthi]|uniref:Uncharacterized protein n=1 Tax=Nonomuraea phyllanthi TaxID=2219224 RepID=A0A5C4W1V6_9ACTN|nr:hypothetical protein [Nonomuraea phyllanthi]KAB8191506.1 hypothetical protein FH608_030070 [Nonomuraea phyllanthi]
MGNSITDLRFTPLLTAEIQAVLERHGYRLPAGSDHVRELVTARVDTALKNLVEVFEGRTW